ncbi:MAG: dihydropteroate synthase [Candidatus Omnitrophica bacterium]|nr:dihydropteroate synthase [Candidatus Omnitrophota bacterium]MDD5352568.1 dihydropteroate synthase [Candidatus Omnitrophota bacterium]MDD5550166.1 dihydropteroate synthase [Candidatus Omnitrophota bacterium]
MLIIGELLNGMYKEVGEAIVKKDKSVIQKIAKAQVDAGADALDLNCGPVSKDPITDMQWLIDNVQSVTDKTIVIDSSKSKVICEAIKKAKNKVIINSTTADKEKLEILVPLAKEYNSGLIALSIDKKGIPQNKEQRLELAANIIAFCMENDFPVTELYLDPVVMPVDVAQAQLKGIIEAVREFKLLCDPSPKTIVGLSNISQGALDRSLVNRTFLVMAQEAGLDAAILDPLDEKLMDALITAELILNQQIYCKAYLEAYRKSKK